ncbi:MAG: hypothetical protein JKY57_04395, partial [Kordiimonadaceae bacterium]|nr:hypothetical protein [Kordiimonadaceae bacterium]
IGRTARAGARGISLSFCDHEERAYLFDIERTIRKSIDIMEDHPFHKEGAETLYDEDGRVVNKPKPREQGGRGRGGGGGARSSDKKPGNAANKNRRRGPKKPSSGGNSGGGNANARSGNRRPRPARG